MRYKCIVSYDGFDYKGFQIQHEEKTIELALKQAIFTMINEDVKIAASGRTDAMVHAHGQVFHFDTDKDIPANAVVRGINSSLPHDIKILSCEKVSDDFHSRFSVKQKEYHYLIKTTEPTVFETRYMAYYKNLDVEAMAEALKLFIGTHNFKGFCSASVNPLKEFVKTIFETKIIVENDVLRFVFIGTGFLKYQIRRMMGLIIEIGLHRQSKEKILEVLEKQDPTLSHKVAPGYGLYLEKVYY